MTKLIVAFRHVANAPKNVTPLVQDMRITDDSKSLHCSLHFHDLFTTYYHVFPIFLESHATAKSFLGHTSAVHFSFSDKQLHVQLTACSPGNV
jgi:hypothetical protein